MVATVLVITVLNCFFMFSTTVSTCALWWQNKRYRNCRRQHNYEKKVHGSDKKKTKKKKEEIICKLDGDFENYIPCPNPDYCYGIYENSPRLNGLSSNRDRRHCQRDYEVEEIEEQEGDIVATATYGNGPIPPTTVETAVDTRSNDDVEKINSKELNSVPDNLNMLGTIQQHNLNKNEDSVSIEKIVTQSVERIPTDRHPSSDAKSTAKLSRNLKVKQCANYYTWSRDTGRYRISNMKNGIKCCGQIQSRP